MKDLTLLPGECAMHPTPASLFFAKLAITSKRVDVPKILLLCRKYKTRTTNFSLLPRHGLRPRQQHQDHRTEPAYRRHDHVCTPGIALTTNTDQHHRLFDSGEDSDFTVKCGNRVWQLHRVILRSGSEYFKNACSEKFEVRLESLQHHGVAYY